MSPRTGGPISAVRQKRAYTFSANIGAISLEMAADPCTRQSASNVECIVCIFFFVNCGFGNSRGLQILIRRPSGRCIASHTETNIHCCRTFSPLEQGRRISIGVDEAFPSRLMTPRILPVLLLAGEHFIDGTDSVCRPSEDYTLHCMMLERGDSWRSLGEDTSSYQTYDSSLMTSVVYIVQSFFRRP